jgi:hypothetical protein
MKKKIVYVEPGDMIEIRVCDPIFDMGANKTAWEESMNPTKHLITVEGFRGIQVSHMMTEVYAWMPGKEPRQMVIYNQKD